MTQENVSVIIPTLNAGSMIDDQLTALEHQHRKPDEIIVVDSSSDDNTREIVKRHPEVRLIVIDRKDFNHGGTRDMALRESKGDFVLFLTQDAMPADDDYISKIIAPLLQNERVGLVYGRQLPRPDAKPAERIVREYSYTSKSFAVTSDDIQRMGIKAFNATDVCAAYRRKAYMEVGGFENPVKTNEDMFIAARLLNAGWYVVYAADAEVVHSHNFSYQEQYKRNYIQGYEIERHRDILGDAPLTGAGLSMMVYTVKKLLKNGNGKVKDAASFVVECGYRYLGNRRGAADAKREQRKAGR
ncbi:MAG: glycosyltransferase [Bifidobacterium sp.]|nr:glycosyltransferase [Bifidobacterium sp.]